MQTFGEMHVVYAAVSVINTMLMTWFCVIAVPVVFRVNLRRHPLLWVLAGLLCVAVGVTRFWRSDPDAGRFINWEFFNTLLPYACVALVVPIKQIWKGLAAAFGYGFVEIVKFIIMMFFFRSAFKDMNDPLELLLELFVHLAAALGLTALLRRKNEKRNIFEPLLQISPILYVLIVVTFGVFVISLAAVSSGASDLSDTKQLIFIFLNIPLVAATVSYAVYSLVKTQTAERNYKMQLEQQIRYYEMMENMNEDLRVFRHDLPKKLRPMVTFLENNDVSSAIEIAQNLAGFSADSDFRFHTGCYRLDTVLSCQQQIAAADGTRIVYTYGSLFPAEGIAPDDIYTIFPNALDNAIEACRQVEGERQITVASRIAGDTVFVTITNPYAVAPVIKRGVPQTAKKDKTAHGYGFRSIKKAAANYGSDNVDVIAENGIFTLRISLCFGGAGSVEEKKPPPGE